MPRIPKPSKHSDCDVHDKYLPFIWYFTVLNVFPHNSHVPRLNVKGIKWQTSWKLGGEAIHVASFIVPFLFCFPEKVWGSLIHCLQTDAHSLLFKSSHRYYCEHICFYHVLGSYEVYDPCLPGVEIIVMEADKYTRRLLTYIRTFV